jgi:hypothetical protein
MGLVDKIEFTVGNTGAYPPEKENARVSISSMSDSELLRFGVRAKFRCSQGSSPNDSEAGDRAAQLDETRAEWNRRHPCLPLRDSF